MAMTVLFVLTLVLDMVAKRRPVFYDLWLPALLWAAAMAWGMLQVLPGLTPAEWNHPVWQSLPETPAHISADPARGPHALVRLSTYAMVFWMALRCAENTEASLRYLRAFAVFSIALASFGIYAAATGSNPILGGLANDRVSASFVNRNNYATFGSFGLVACLSLLLRNAARAQNWRKNALAGFFEGIMRGGWVWIAGVTICGGAILLSQSRGGMMAAMIGVLVLLSTQRQRGNRAALGPTLIILALLGAVFFSASTGTLNRIVESGEQARFIVYPAVVEAIGDRPLLGHGIGAFHTAFRAYVPLEAASGEWDMAHNSYLENAFEMGLPAALLFYLALALIGLRLLRGVLTRHRNRSVVATALACFLLAAFHALFDFSLQMPALAAFFAWILGIGYAQSFPSAEVKGTPR
jgi:O-antigen ligase